MTRLDLRRGLTALLAGTALCTVPTYAGAQEQHTLVLYHQLSETEVVPVRERFIAHYESTTGNTLEFSDFFQPGGQLQSTVILEARGNAVQADVIILPPDSLMTIAAAAPDLLADYTPPTLSDPEVSEAAREGSLNSQGTIFNMAPYVINYNSEKLTGDDIPKSWLDLLDPKFQHQIGLGDLEQTGGARAPLWFLVKKQGELGAPWGWAYYEALGAQEPRLFSGHGQLIDLIATGELTVGIASYAGAIQATEAGSPVAAILPIEGAGGQPTSVDIVKSSMENPAAVAFVDWLLSQDGQEAAYEGTRTNPIRSDVEMDPAPFEFDVHSALIFPADSKWISENMTENVAKFREALD